MTEGLPSLAENNVLDDVRRALGRTATLRPAPLERFIECAAETVGSDLALRLTCEAAAVGVHVHSLRGVDETIERVGEICAAVGGEVALSDAEFLSAIDLRSALTARGLSTFRCSEQDSLEHEGLIARLAKCGVGVTAADCAIAETGTIVLSSDETNALLVSLLPPVHVAVLRSSQIVASLDEAITNLSSRRTNQADAWSSATFITGPSRTGDVELTLSIGVHGPKELHVIVLE
jgi:L-lactate dehydrogenase complex protein LldG